ncbi:MAG: PASTA domain-containing protein, partial [Pseudomonadota bacterium]
SVSTSAMSLNDTITIQHSLETDSEKVARGIPNYLGPAVISPDGLSAWVPSKQDNIQRGVFRDGQELTHDSTVRAITSRIDLVTGQEDYMSRVDHDDAGVPKTAAFGPFGNYLFVVLEASRDVIVLDAYGKLVVANFVAGRAPQGLVLSPDGQTLYVHNFMDRSISVFDVSGIIFEGAEAASLVTTLDAVSIENLSATVLNGKQLFYDARDPRLALQAYMSCAACHNDAEQDGRVWDLSGFGEGLRNSISLRGRAGMGHGFLHWSANFDEVQDFEGQIRDLAGGTGLMSDADFNSGTRSDPLGTPKAGVSADLDALAAYLDSLDTFDISPYRANGGGLTPAGVAGKAVFDAENCIACHGGANFSDAQMHDVGTITAASGDRLGGALSGIETPTLRGVWSTAPYLHDGSADTLADAVQAHNNTSVIGQQLSDLVAYLQQIDGAEPDAATPPSTWQSQDIGAVAAAGSFTEDTGTFTIEASGRDIWNAADEFHFAYQPLNGDGEIIARVVSLVNTNVWAKAGVMMRESLDDNSRHASMVASARRGLSFQRRVTPGANSQSSNTGGSSPVTPHWVRLVREGDVFTGYESEDGVSWTQVGQITISMNSTLFVGLAVTSHNDGVLTTAEFDNVSIIPGTPPPPDTTPPSVPQNLVATTIDHTQIGLSWNASTDSESGVSGYNIFRDGGGSPIATVSGTSYTDGGLTPNTSYTYTVSAFDGATPLNESLQSAAANATTSPEPTTATPDVVGLDQATAESTITGAGLVVGTVTTQTDPAVPAGEVISQDPTAGTVVVLGTAVDLVVSSGAAPVSVPDVVGQAQATAESNIVAANLVVGTVTTQQSSAPAGEVISQNPTGGTQVPVGSAVDLVVSSGPDTDPPSVPQNVSGSGTGATTISLSWDASTDSGSGVASYNIYRDGSSTPIGTSTTTGYNDGGLSSDTSYSYTVSAVDNEGNESAQSIPAVVSTLGPSTWQSQDIGAVAAAGSFTEDTGTFTIEASGSDIWNTADEFHFAYQPLDGDGEIIARVDSLVNTYVWAKAGVMMRETLDDNSRHASMFATPRRGLTFQRRVTPGASSQSDDTGGRSVVPHWVRLVRAGDVFTGYESEDGVSWTQVGQITISMNSTLFVGLAVTSHNDGVLTTAVFDSVEIVQP